MKFPMVKNGLKEHLKILKRGEDAILTWKNDFKKLYPVKKGQEPMKFTVKMVKKK